MTMAMGSPPAKKCEARIKANTLLDSSSSNDKQQQQQDSHAEESIEERRVARRASRLQKGASSRGLGLQRGGSFASSRGLGRRSASSGRLILDNDNKEEVADAFDTTAAAKTTSHTRRRIPRRTTSMELMSEQLPRTRRPLQRNKSCDGSQMPFKRIQRRPTLALAERSASVRRLGSLGGGSSSLSLTRAKSERRFTVEQDGTDEPMIAPRRRHDATNPIKDDDGSNQDNSSSGGVSSSRRRRSGTNLRAVMMDDASGDNTNSSVTSGSRRRGVARSMSSGGSGNRRRGSGVMTDDSSGLRRGGVGRTASGMAEDSSAGSRRRGVARTNSGEAMNASSNLRCSRGVDRNNSGGTMDDSSNAANLRRSRGVARTPSGIGENADTMRRRQTQRWVQKAATEEDEHDDEHVFDVEPQDGVVHGKGLGDSSRRRREPTLSRMSINDLRSRLIVGTQAEKEGKEEADGETDTSESGIWHTDNAAGPLESNLNDDW